MTEFRYGMRIEVLLSLQCALWDEVTPELRGVSVRIGDNDVTSRLTFERVPTVYDLEVVSEVETYVIADLPPRIQVLCRAEHLPMDQPRELESGEEWVYPRREQRSRSDRDLFVT